MRRFVLPRAVLFFPMAALLAACGSTGGGTQTPSAQRQLSFGVDMARRELWSEALFRFHQAEVLDPQNPRIQNNLAVAYEATGDFEQALKHYQQALRLDPNNRDLRANWTRFSQFYSAFTQQKRAQAGQPGQPGQPTPPGAAAPATPPTIGRPSPTPTLAQPPQTAPVQPPVDSQPDQNPPPPPPAADPSSPSAFP
jgi:hypothetical protein